MVVLIVVRLRRLEAQTLRHDNAGDRGAAIIQHSRHEDYRQEGLMMKMLMGMVTTIQELMLPSFASDIDIAVVVIFCDV